MTLVAHGRRDRNTAARPLGPSGAWRALGWLAALLCSLLGATAAWASEPGPSRAEIEFFEKQVRPLLVGRCLKCHGQEQQKGGLRLDRLAGLLDGGDSGPAMVRGKPEDSLLIEAVNYRSLEMPPDRKLGDAELTEQEIMSLSGHVTPAAARLYVKRTERQRLQAAIKRRD